MAEESTFKFGIFVFPSTMDTRKMVYTIFTFIFAVVLTFIFSFHMEPGVSIVLASAITVLLGVVREIYSKVVQKKTFDDVRWLFNLLGASMSAIAISMFIQ